MPFNKHSMYFHILCHCMCCSPPSMCLPSLFYPILLFILKAWSSVITSVILLGKLLPPDSRAGCSRDLELNSICFSFFFFKWELFIYLFIYFWLCWVLVSVRELSLVAASGGHSSSRCAGLSLSRPLLLRNTGSRCAGSVIVAHGPSCSAACGIFPGQGSNPCPLH